ncbi:ATP-binding protein [Streptomyces sp. NPDC091376]|uniref:ATP-binding protein n=1 Tax=Streptomyces sp. NPDC091376 TaxID=3365994 RepID=UPI0037F34FFF
MVGPAIGFTKLPHAGRLPWSRPRPHRTPKEPAATPHGERHNEWASKDASTSWLARHLGLWARSLEPLRPLDAPAARATAREMSWPLARELTSAGRARRLVTGLLQEWDLTDLTDTAELLVSELVTNALRHAHGPVRLNLRVSEDRLRCEVEDTNDAAPVRRIACMEAEGGRGAELLDLLSQAWGSFHTGTGKTTWFELTTPTKP